MSLKKVLFIGRFQPFHKGHLGTLEKIAKLKDVGSIVIGIGSSDQSFTASNPFTAKEREEMIRAGLKLKIPFEIKFIPDIPSDEEWTKVLLEKYFDGDLVYSGNDWVVDLLTKAGLEVRTLPKIDNPSGTEIRRMMVEGKKWQQFVPKEVEKIVKKFAGVQRINQIPSK